MKRKTNKPQIGAAWLAGARFDVAIGELRKGNFVPKSDNVADVQGIAHGGVGVGGHEHVEL